MTAVVFYCIRILELTYSGENSEEMWEQQSNEPGKMLIAEVFTRSEHVKAFDRTIHEVGVVRLKAFH